MGRTYYEIEVTARQLTGLLVLLAVLLMVAFVLGYGAAWSVFSARPGPAPAPIAEATPTAVAEVVVPTPTEPPRLSAAERPTPTAETTAAPEPTRAPTRPPATPAPPSREGFWVQVLAVRTESAVREARAKLDGLGFPRDHQWVAAAPTAGGDTLYKVRVGPFPDRNSADRVVRRMAAADFPDAWVVTP